MRRFDATSRRRVEADLTLLKAIYGVELLPRAPIVGSVERINLLSTGAAKQARANGDALRSHCACARCRRDASGEALSPDALSQAASDAAPALSCTRLGRIGTTRTLQAELPRSPQGRRRKRN